MAGLDNVIGNLKGCEDRMRAELKALGHQFSLQMEAYAKQNVPWENRTHKAREGLFGEVAEADGKLKVRIAHSVKYGTYLELGRKDQQKGRRPILEPTAQKFAPEFFEAAKELLTK